MPTTQNEATKQHQPESKSLQILAVGTEWSSGHGGLSTFNRQLCSALAAIGARVVCLVIRTSPEERLSAGNVTLSEATRTTGQPEHELLSRKPRLPDGFEPDVIIGHGRVTGPAAQVLAEDHFPSAKRLHFVHMAPDEIEWFKLDRNDDAGARAEERTQIELDLGRTAARVVAVGPRLYGRYATELHSYRAPSPIQFDPGFDGLNDELNTPPPGTPWRILVLGRLEDYDLKGIDLASKAVGLTMERRENTEAQLEFIARGARPDSSAELKEKLQTWSGNPALSIVVRPFTTNAESIEADIRRASLVLMPSRKEGFGLVGLEAIVAGTPALISSESGLGELLRTTLSQEQAARIVVRTSGNSTKDQETWARAVEGVLRDRESAFHRANEVRRLLAAKKTWIGAVRRLLSEIELTGPSMETQLAHADSKNEVQCARKHGPSVAESGWPTSSSRISNPETTIRCIDDYEPSPDIFGRSAEVEIVVDALASGIPAIVAGGPGMGKTSVVTAALYDSRVIDRFGRRRVFASLEAATEPRAIVSKLVETLGVSPIGDEATLLRILATSAAERPIAAVLDNAETVFDSNRIEAERLLNLIMRIKGLSVVTTIRGVPPPATGAILIDDLPKLPPPAAREAFLSIAGVVFATDPDLPPLLDAFDGHALSICLVAAQANGLPSLRGLRESWDEAHAEILRRPGEEEGRLNSVRASLALSLASRRMKSSPFARRLMALLGFLPAGLPVHAVARLLGDRGMVSKATANDAVGCLHQLRLIERRLDGRLRMLTPLRESVKRDVSPLTEDKKRLIDHYLEIATKAYAVGGRRWEKVKADVEGESDNLDPICELAIAARTNLRRLNQALVGLADFHVFSGRAAVSSLSNLLAKHDKGFPPAILGNCARGLGDIAGARSDHETALSRFREALALSRRAGDLMGQANSIQGLGEIARLRSDESAHAQYEEALALFRRVGGRTLGEANCIMGLGEIARNRNDYKTARTRYEEALALFRRIDGVTGEAGCFQGLGQIASALSDYKTARTRIEEALGIFRSIGSVMGEASCVFDLSDLALAHSNHSTARALCEEAQALFRRIGSVTGEANCTLNFGAIAQARCDDETARLRFEEALTLYRRTGTILGEANCIQRLGVISNARSDPEAASSQFEEALAFHRRDGRSLLHLLSWRNRKDQVRPSNSMRQI